MYWYMCVLYRVQSMQGLSVDGSLQFNAQFECGNLRKAIQVIDTLTSHVAL